MYVTRCDAGMTWDGNSCTGGATAFTWNDGSTNYQETYLTSYTTGASNTTSLASYTGYTDYPYAGAVYCDNLTENGKSDWYLPAVSELTVIYGNKDEIGNFAGNNMSYMTSTERDSSTYQYRNFTSGDTYGGKWKYNTMSVRCARKD